MSDAVKITILTKIRENKAILFGKFSENLTKQHKENGWKSITEEAISLGLIPSDKHWKYMRDTTWQNWRKRTIEKRDHKAKTGKSGGKKLLYDSIDLLVLEIIGIDSPIINGLQIPESSGTSLPTSTEAQLDHTCTENSSQIEANTANSDAMFSISRISQRKKRTMEKEKDTDEEHKLKLRKLSAQVEGLELENFKRHLEIVGLEVQLGLQPSTQTASFITKYYP